MSKSGAYSRHEAILLAIGWGKISWMVVGLNI